MVKEYSENINELKLVLKIPIKQYNLVEERVFEAIDLKLKGIENQKNEVTNDEEEYRYQEYNFIKNKDPNDNDDLELKIRKLPMEKYGILNNYFENIFLVDSLIETRVQTGFTRMLPYDPSKESSIQTISLDNLDWYPGITVKGEGIFLNLIK